MSKEKQVPSAEEILKQHYVDYCKSDKCTMPEKHHEAFVKTMTTDLHGINPVKDAMIEFAKIHVQAALKAASEKAEAGMYVGMQQDESKFSELQDLESLHLYVEEKSILSAYDLNEIK